jgi:2-dehydro-3-deoxyphosphogalactonate aldolase
VGGTCDLLIGTHGQMTASSAIRLAKRLEPFDPLWLEEPVPPENLTEMARVARATSIPIATGERLATKYDFVGVLQHQAASILQLALGRSGGILEAKKIAGMAEAHYAQIAPHLYCGPIEGAANIQIDTCSPNFLIQESIETWGGFHAEILKRPVQWQDGYIIPPTAPGLGVELDEEVAAQHPGCTWKCTTGRSDFDQSSSVIWCSAESSQARLISTPQPGPSGIWTLPSRVSSAGLNSPACQG